MNAVDARRRLGFAAAAAAVALACAPDAQRGTEERVYLRRPSPTSSPIDAGVDAEPPPPAVVSSGPTSGPYGTEIVITGEGLGSAGREGVTITLESETEVLELTPEAIEVTSWTESEVRIRFPFPLGRSDITVATPQGSALIGSFTPSWAPGAALQARSGATVTASIATDVGTVAALFASSSLWLVEGDGAIWTEADLVVPGVQAETARLYLDEQSELRGFVLSNASPPEIVALSPAADGWTATPTGLVITANFAIAGGTDGAVVWYADSADDWYRARPIAGTWSVDLGPIADPNPTASRHAAAASSDGGLVIGYGKSTGDFLDDRGAPYVRVLDLATMTFGAEARAGLDVDDHVASLVMEGRGSGVLLTYVGSEPGSDFHLVPWPALGPSQTRAPPESETARYGFNAGVDAPAGIAYCSDALGTRRVPALTSNRDKENDLDAESGEVLIWPCADILAAEFDPAGELVVMVQWGGALYVPRPRMP